MWKTIKGYEGLYEISDKGEVRSFDRILPCGHNSSHIRKGKILTPCGNGKGYLQIYLIKDGKAKKYYIHRLVAEAFIDNPNNYPIINHKDENRSNNEVSNLEWCTHLDNVRHAIRTGLIEKVCKIERTVEINPPEGDTVYCETMKDACSFFGFTKCWLGNYIRKNGNPCSYKGYTIKVCERGV